ARLVRRGAGPILRLCAKMPGDASRAEDLTQEAFARVFTKRREFQPQMRFATWLWRIALNLCYDELRKVQRRGEASFAMLDAETNLCAEGDGPDAQAASAEEGELVRAALLRLAERPRAVLGL